jgi:hypothetical protein
MESREFCDGREQMVSLFQVCWDGQSERQHREQKGKRDWDVSAFISVRNGAFWPGAKGRDFISLISSVIVAENKRVCLPCEALGRTSMQIDKSSAKVGSRRRSASSRTRDLHRLNPPAISSPEEDVMISASRPGVATTM